MRISLTKDDQKLIGQVGERIKFLRSELGISQDELALRADTTKSQIYRIEHGEINSSIATFGRIAKALDVELKTLFDINSQLS